MDPSDGNEQSAERSVTFTEELVEQTFRAQGFAVSEVHRQMEDWLREHPEFESVSHVLTCSAVIPVVPGARGMLRVLPASTVVLQLWYRLIPARAFA